MLNFEILVKTIVEEVLKEIIKQGGEINLKSLLKKEDNQGNIVIDMSMYSTPVLTEKRMAEIRSGVIVVPKGTVLTPGAREAIKRKKITINYQTN